MNERYLSAFAAYLRLKVYEQRNNIKNEHNQGFLIDQSAIFSQSSIEKSWSNILCNESLFAKSSYLLFIKKLSFHTEVFKSFLSSHWIDSHSNPRKFNILVFTKSTKLQLVRYETFWIIPRHCPWKGSVTSLCRTIFYFCALLSIRILWFWQHSH